MHAPILFLNLIDFPRRRSAKRDVRRVSSVVNKL